MATGSYDSNGIWHYGEDDNIALFSDTLNKLAVSTSSGFTSDRSRLATLEAGSLAGLVPIVPSSVTFVTGTGTTNEIGTITATGCTSIEIKAFTGNYTNYKIVVSGTKGATAGALFCQMQLAGVSSAVNYSGGWSGFLAGTTSTTAATDTTLLPLITAQINDALAVELNVYQPAVAASTRFTGTALGTNATVFVSALIGGRHSVSTAYDGIRLAMSAGGTFTGQINIYGFND